ncbi:MAG: lamin tail domain-containing protein [Pirellulales bacterium]|nr:lamin tail domain-containing protein [Pirellulales bacterium]
MLLSVVINEIHYNPADNTSPSEYIELYNTGIDDVDLSGWAFTDGIDYVFSQGIEIPSGEFLVIAQDPATILAEFGVGSAGPWIGNLNNDGENIVLRDSFGTIIDEVDYRVGFPWPLAASGDGGSMELIHPLLDNNLGSSWRSSYVPPMVPSEPDAGGASSLDDLVHRWSFSGDLVDSVGNADGILIDPGGIAVFRSDRLDLSANSGQNSDQSPFTSGAYVDLPNGIISSLGNEATFEWWGTVSKNRTWAEIFSFGTSNGGEDSSISGSNQNYLTLIPLSGSGTLRITHRNGSTGSENYVDDSTALAVHAEQHIAVVWDGQEGTQSLYLNGTFIGSSPTLISLSNIQDVNNWLGRSQWPDPLFDGIYNEFRVYDRALSDTEIAFSFADGPDAVEAGPVIHSFVADHPEIRLGESVTLSWNVSDFNQLTIDQGVGDVTEWTHITLFPEETTTYTLSATNLEGTTNRHVTVTVSVPLSTPGLVNYVYAENAAPNIRQVDHGPQSPASGESVTITAKVTDPDGVQSVQLEYQVVLPGNYIPATLPVPLDELSSNGNLEPTPNPAYFDPANWTTLMMADDGTAGDEVAGDNIFSAVIPAQGHRTLVRYRIAITDMLGFNATVPYPDDPSLNFAYFVYDGMPEYRDEFNQVVADADALESVPTYHFITRAEDMDEVLAYDPADQISQGTEARFAYNWSGAIVYNGVVYDNIHYRLRGANGRYYLAGKRSMRFRFNKGNYFKAHDQDGNPYPTEWRTLTTGKGFDNLLTLTYGLNEAVTMYLSNLIGLPASETHWFQFRVIDDAAEAPDPWHGDFWGLNFAQETYDIRFLEAHDLEKGNLYKLINQTQDALEQQRYQAPNAVSDGSDHDFIEDYLTRSSNDIEERVNLAKYYLFHALSEAVRNYDFWPTANKNMVYYFAPEYRPENDFLGELWILPWDTDATWGPTWNNGQDVVYDALFFNNSTSYRNSLIKPDYYNTLRELRDLVWQPDQLEGMINEFASAMIPLEAADRVRWEGSPSDAGNYNGLIGAGAVSIAYLVQDMLNFAFVGGNWPGGNTSGSVGPGGRAAYLDDLLAASGEESLIPVMPTISYVGLASYAANGLAFQTTSFSDPQGTATFGAMQWRIAEVTDASAGADPSQTFQPEWITTWDSGVLAVCNNTISPPVSAVVPGQTYRARVRFQDNTGRWSHWSEPLEFTPTESDHAQTLIHFLRITEVNYNPYAALVQFGDNNVDNDKFEFIELENTSPSETLDLSGVSLNDGIEFTFANGQMLEPGQFVVVVESLENFISRYGTEVHVAGQWSGALNNAGDSITLLAPGGSVIQHFEYDNSGNWPGRADGKGSSLEVIDPEGDYSSADNWRSSNEYGGSPGTAGTGPVYDVIVNEVLSHSDGSLEDWIELYNLTGAPIDIGKWYLSDDSENLFQFQVPGNAIIPNGEYLLLAETFLGFALDGEFGDDVWLIDADGLSGKPLRFADHVDFDATDSNVSLGRWLNGDPSGMLFPMTDPTPGTANSGPVFGNLQVTEVHYNPGEVPTEEQANIAREELEFIEIYNRSSTELDIGNWVVEGIQFEFPSGTAIAAQEAIVLVTFDPILEPAKEAAFRNIFSMAPGSRLFGAASGQLNNAGERIQLLKPLDPVLFTTGRVLVDAVPYDELAPWPTEADGGGDSLTRTSAYDFAPFASSWIASSPSPGSVPFVAPMPGDFNADGNVDSDDLVLWKAGFGTLMGAVTGDGDADKDGDVDGQDFLIWQQNFQSPSASTGGASGSSIDLCVTNEPGRPAGARQLLILSPQTSFDQRLANPSRRSREYLSQHGKAMDHVLSRSPGNAWHLECGHARLNFSLLDLAVETIAADLAAR